MSDTDLRPTPDLAGSTGTGEATPRPRRMSRETAVLLFALPVLVLVVFGAWVVWRLTADLDATAAGALAWSAIGSRLWEHVLLTLVSAAVVLVVAIPLGIALTRPRLRRAAPLFVGVANAGQAAPSIGLIVLLAMWLDFGFTTAVVALALYAILPVLRNTIVGLQGVDPTLVEAGRGVGMSSQAVLLRIELPLAVPVIMTGVRTALVLLVGTAALATFVGAGGLGTFIDTGIKLYQFPVLISGAILVALLALLVDWLGRVLELVVRPRGL